MKGHHEPNGVNVGIHISLLGSLNLSIRIAIELPAFGTLEGLDTSMT